MNGKKLLALLMVLLMLLVVAQPLLASTKRAARILELSGSVSYQKGGGERELKAFKGMSLAQGDRLITGADGKAVLEIDTDKKLTVGANSVLDLSQLSGTKGEDEQTRLNMWKGEVLTEIGDRLNTRSRFEIKTPTAVMGVRGTWFVVGQQADGTYIAVIEGALYALSNVPAEQGEQFAAFLEENEQLTLDELASFAEGIQAEPLTLEQLPLVALQDLQQNVDKLPPALKEQVEQNIQQVIEQKQQQVQQQQQQIQQQIQQILGGIQGMIPTLPPTAPTFFGGGGGGDTPPAPPTETYTPEAYFEYTEASGSAKITNFLPRGPGDTLPVLTSIAIPPTLGGMNVAVIGTNTFKNKGLTAVLFPSTLSVIEDNAFQQNAITALAFPAALTSIGSFAFDNNQIAAVSFGSVLTHIGASAFNNNLLTVLVIPSSITNIGAGAFAQNAIVSVTMPGSMNLGNISGIVNTFGNHDAGTPPDTTPPPNTGAFLEAYTAYEKQAGTYIWNTENWLFQGGSGITAVTTKSTHYLVVFHPSSLIPADNPITAASTPITTETTVAAFLNNLNLPLESICKVFANENNPLAGTPPVNGIVNFTNNTAKGDSDTLADNDLLFVLAGDGTTLRGYRITVTAPLAMAHHVVATAASLTPVVGATNQITLTVKDSANNIDTTFSGSKSVTVTGALQSPTGTYGSFKGINLTGFTTVVAGVSFSNGVATTNLVLHKAATQNISFSVFGVTNCDSSPIAITPTHSTATGLAVVQQPVAGARTGSADLLATQPSVKIVDAYGNTIISSTVEVGVNKGGVTEGWILGGTTAVNAVGGIATFTDLTITAEANVSGAVLAFSSDGLSGTASTSFGITATVLSSDTTVTTKPDHYEVISDAESLLPAENAIWGDVTPILDTTTVGTLLGNLNQPAGSTWKVFDNAHNPFSESPGHVEVFNSTPGKSEESNLAIGDFLFVLAEDGSTLRGYSISIPSGI